MAKDLTRNDLYKLVWQRPITEVAKEYGLSDRGLSKLCERYGIPVPPRGYWAKVNNGHKVHVPQLISLNSNADNKMVIVSNTRTNTHKLPDNLKEALDAEKLPENKIIVQENINHDLLPNIKTTKKLSFIQKRSRKILCSLLSALESRGFLLTQNSHNKNQISVNYKQSNILISINQYTKRSYETINGVKKVTHEPTENLVLKIYSEDCIVLKAFLDTKEKPLEESLNAVVIYIIKKLWKEQEEYIFREEKLLKIEQEEQLKADIIFSEQQKIEELEQRVKNWLHAKDIQNYVDFVQNTYSEDCSAWCEWASSYSKKIAHQQA